MKLQLCVYVCMYACMVLTQDFRILFSPLQCVLEEWKNIYIPVSPAWTQIRRRKKLGMNHSLCYKYMTFYDTTDKFQSSFLCWMKSEHCWVDHFCVCLVYIKKSCMRPWDHGCMRPWSWLERGRFFSIVKIDPFCQTGGSSSLASSFGTGSSLFCR